MMIIVTSRYSNIGINTEGTNDKAMFVVGRW